MKLTHINRLCKILGLGQSLSLPTEIFGGLLHNMWQVHTSQGTFAIKQLAKNTHSIINNHGSYELTEKIANLFLQAGIPTIAAIAVNNNYIIDIENESYIVYPWLNAKPLEKNTASLEQTTKIAKILAKIHAINLQLSTLSNAAYDIHENYEILALINQSSVLNLPFADDLKKHKSFLLETNDQYIDIIPYLKRNTILSHADLNQSNVVWENSNPIIIDWEFTCKTNPTLELISMSLDWSRITNQLNEEIFLSMLRTYQRAGGYLETNLQAIFYGILGNWLNWIIYN
ncbi:MAG: hypothetical protein ACD_20C00074G0002, partial [uncultured bacterium]